MKSSERSNVGPFIVMDVMENARKLEEQGHHIIHMEVGQPSTGAPQKAIEALTNAMENDALGYTVALGLPELRTGIAKLYKDWYGLDISPERVVVTAGSSAAFQLAFISLFNPNDNVAIGDPGYPSYRNTLKALSLNPVSIETTLANRYQPTVSDLQKHNDLDGLLVASPSNPTGTMLDKDALKALIDHCQKNDIAFISDEIYHGLEYDKKAVTALEISDDVYVINSFSKYFSMTGWRIGWMVVPQNHVRRIERLMQNLFICAPNASQVAATAALDCQEELSKNLELYARNRDYLMQELPKAGFTKIAPPDGAFYIYADVSDFGFNSVDLANEILENAKVSVTSGLDFDPKRGNTTLRFSYARSHEDMIEGVKRLKEWYKKRPR